MDLVTQDAETEMDGVNSRSVVGNDRVGDDAGDNGFFIIPLYSIMFQHQVGQKRTCIEIVG